jgi:PAS domain S-box-containing protein
MELKIIVALSVLSQLAAAVLALRLIRVTGRQVAWILVSLALFGMAVRRVIPLYGLYAGLSPSVMDPAFEWVGLGVSLCMLAGVAWIAPVFETIRNHGEKLRRSEERFRRIVDTAQEGILFTDASGNARYVNQRMADMVGWTTEEMRGRPVTDFLPGGCACIERMTNVGRSGSLAADRHDCQFRRKDGSDLWTMVSCNVLRDDGGTSIGSLAMVTDISDRKKMERERESLITELQDALANVKTLKGLLPICAWCNKVKDDSGDWHPMEVYIKIHSDASFSHGICPECRAKM